MHWCAPSHIHSSSRAAAWRRLGGSAHTLQLHARTLAFLGQAFRRTAMSECRRATMLASGVAAGSLRASSIASVSAAVAATRCRMQLVPERVQKAACCSAHATKALRGWFHSQRLCGCFITQPMGECLCILHASRRATTTGRPWMHAAYSQRSGAAALETAFEQSSCRHTCGLGLRGRGRAMDHGLDADGLGLGRHQGGARPGISFGVVGVGERAGRACRPAAVLARTRHGRHLQQQVVQ